MAASPAHARPGEPRPTASAPPRRLGEPAGGRRLLCVYQHAPTPGAPGIYRHRRYLAELVRRGWTVDLVSTPRNYMTGKLPREYRRRPVCSEAIDGITHHWIWTPGGIHRSRGARAANYAAFASAAAARAVTLPRPDTVLVSSPPLPVGALGPLLARRFACPWLLEVRDVWPESAVSVGWLRRESLAYGLLERLAHATTSRAARVVIPTPGLEPFVRRHGAREVVLLPGAVVPRPDDPARRRAVRDRLGVGSSECVFLYLGAIGVANGLDVLVDAVARLDEGTPPLRIVVAGDGSARQSLEATIAARGLDRITLLPAMSRDEAEDLLAAADVGLHLLLPDPVFGSALPTKALDYLGARLPFVTTVPGLPAEVALASGGAAVSSAPELARELERWAAADPETRRGRGEQALGYGLERFSLQAGADRLEAALEEVLAESQS
ncbi:MAG: glycosyltransferase family 4 protein [Gaiellaceae bacterium]